MQRLENEGFACAAVDITAIGTADITPVEWYAGIIDYLVDSFNLYTDFELKSWWQDNALLSPVQHFSKFIETVLLERVEQNIIIFIDEIDSILSLEFNLAWVEQELAQLRPYSDAINAWMASNYKDESRLLRGQALQDALLWVSNKGLSDKDNQFLRASQELDKREVAIALDAERQAKEILAAAQAKAQLALEEERQANQRLTEAQRKTQRQVRVGTGILAVSVIGAIVASVVAGKAETERQYALTATRLERDGVNILRQFQGGGEIASLQLAIRTGQELKSLVKDKKSLADYPAYSPIFSLQEILLNIHERNQLQGHESYVNGVAFSPDGKTLASGSGDRTIKLWNVTTGKEIASLSGHQDGVTSVAFSADGKTLASGSYDKTIKLWNVATGKEIASLSGHQDGVNSVAFSAV